MKNLYGVLGVHRKATPTELQEARRELARTHHPDHGGGVDKMVEINAAYFTLHDPKRRKEYDIYLASAGYACSPCEGEGFIRVQKGFTKAEKKTCTMCMGAGRILEAR